MSNVRTTAAPHDPVVSASVAYNANDVVGDLQSIRLPTVAGVGVLKSIMVIDIDNQKAPLTILYFFAKPSGIAADNAAAALSAADAKLLAAKVDIAAGDYESIGGRAVACVEVSRVIRGAKDTANSDGSNQGDARNLWVSIVTPGTPTYTTTSSLRLVHGILTDN